MSCLASLGGCDSASVIKGLWEMDSWFCSYLSFSLRCLLSDLEGLITMFLIFLSTLANKYAGWFWTETAAADADARLSACSE